MLMTCKMDSFLAERVLSAPFHDKQGLKSSVEVCALPPEDFQTAAWRMHCRDLSRWRRCKAACRAAQSDEQGCLQHS